MREKDCPSSLRETPRGARGHYSGTVFAPSSGRSGRKTWYLSLYFILFAVSSLGNQYLPIRLIFPAGGGKPVNMRRFMAQLMLLLAVLIGVASGERLTTARCEWMQRAVCQNRSVAWLGLACRSIDLF